MSIVKNKRVLIQRIIELSAWKIILIGYLFTVAVALLFGYVLFPEEPVQHLKEKMGYLFIMSVVFAPLIETYLTQHLIIHYTHKWTKRYWIGVLGCSLIFAALHYYSIIYIAKTFFTGLVYSSAYAIFHKQKSYPVSYVSLIHALHNLTAIFFNAVIG